MATQGKQIQFFLIRLLVFAVPVILLHLWAAFKAGGKTDSYYPKFITPKQTSLIIGTSRAEQCLVPAVMNPVFAQRNKNIALYNYAFNLDVTPFGKAYLASIRQKLDTNSRNGLFIICPDPWAISIERYMSDDDNGQSENSVKSPLYMHNVSASPNFEYLLKHYSFGWGALLTSAYSGDTTSFTHPDGWLELSLNMAPALNAKRTYNRTKIYQDEMVAKYKYSASRFNYLQLTIKYLQQYGKVVLVRLPVSPAIYEVEKKYIPGFDENIQGLAAAFGVQYLDYAGTGGKYLFTDGNHMYKRDGKIFSNTLAQDILAKGILR